jgi:plasmid stabilization system protein ParE
LKSQSTADRLIDRIFNRTSQLKDFPESGQVEVTLAERNGSRYLVEGFYKIVYIHSIEKSEVIITDIFHTSQDPFKLNK